MLTPGRIVIGLCLAVAGCSTMPNRAPVSQSPGSNSSGPTNRVAHNVQQVREPPRLAPPPTNVSPHVSMRTPTLSPPAAVPSQAPVTATSAPPAFAGSHSNAWISLERWSRENNVGLLRRISSSPVSTYALTAGRGVLVIQAKSLRATWNGIELRLGFEPQSIDDQPFVHALDLRKNIEPLIHGVALPAKADRVIIIDPGHGGQNAGAESVMDGSYEKEYTLDWARRLEPLLARRGCRVFLTRTNDLDVSLADRVEFAEQHQADLFVSLHFNSAAPNREQAGLETFCLTPAGMPSTLVREFTDDPSLVYPNNAFDADNLGWAFRLHRTLLREAGLTDRGVRRARFMVVLRGQRRPAVLIEGGYLSNPREARRIADPAYRQRLAEAVAEALLVESDAGGEASPAGAPPTAKSTTNRSALR